MFNLNIMVVVVVHSVSLNPRITRTGIAKCFPDYNNPAEVFSNVKPFVHTHATCSYSYNLFEFILRRARISCIENKKDDVLTSMRCSEITMYTVPIEKVYFLE